MKAPVAEPAAPEDTATTAPTAPSAPAVAPPAPEPVTLAVTPEAPVNYAQTYAINIQGAPESGGKCVGVPSRPIAQGMALQLGPCGGVSAQTFSYDSVNKRLAIGGLCVDTADGTAKAGDPLRQLDAQQALPFRTVRTELERWHVPLLPRRSYQRAGRPRRAAVRVLRRPAPRSRPAAAPAPR